jgi:hypothetical protein
VVVVSPAPLSAQAAITIAMTMARVTRAVGRLRRWPSCFLVVTSFSSFWLVFFRTVRRLFPTLLFVANGVGVADFRAASKTRGPATSLSLSAH